MRKIALVNQKGGCGKTTTAVNLASCLSLKGKRVLLIDLDPQGHSGLGVGIEHEQIEKSIYELLLGQIKIKEAIYVVHENLHIVLSDVVLSAFEQIMSGVAGREFRLNKCLGDLAREYDYLIIDTPPSVGLLTFNGLMACHEVIVPVDSSAFSLHGLGKLFETLKLIEEKRQRAFSVRILATNLDRRTKYSKTVLKTLREDFSDQCFDTIIHTSTRLREAAAQGKPIAEYDTNCRAYRDYAGLTKELLSAEAAMAGNELTAMPLVPAEKTVVFALKAPAHADVQIAGDFNNWQPEALSYTEATEAPLWWKGISLKPGSYQYKYLLDGQWIADPHNENRSDDPFGGINSLIEV